MPIFVPHNMEEEHFTYKVAGWILLILLTLQPAGIYKSLSDDWTASTNAEVQFCQELPASVDEALPLQSAFALRLRNQHFPATSTGLQTSRPIFFYTQRPANLLTASASDFIRRRSALCIYRI